MRDYLSPAKRYVSRVIPHPGTIGTYVSKRKALSFAIVASFVVITTIGFVSVKGLTQNPKTYQDSVSKNANSSVETTVTNTNLSEPASPVAEPADQSSSTSSGSDTSSKSTSVTVNNQPIEVPENGSVHKVIQSGDGKTEVNISVNSNSNGSTSTNTSTSTNLNVNTNTSSRITESHSQ
jgi:hypothetical protein